MRGRDTRGRFIKGNTIAKGNKGNTESKWGNQNALKHGIYSRYKGLNYIKGFVYVIVNNYSVGVLSPKDYVINDGYGTEKIIYIKRRAAKYLMNTYHLNKKSFIETEKRNFLRYVERDKNPRVWIALFESHQRNVIRP